MNTVIKKLQYKLQPEVLIVNAPEEFRAVLDEWKKMATVQSDGVAGKTFNFAMIFVKTSREVNAAAKKFVKMLEPDAVFWMAYPKKTSKKYKAEITRDDGWQALGDLGYEGVAMVSVDDDWSAFRFRKPDFIKTLNRRESMAMSSEGKAKVNREKSKAESDFLAFYFLLLTFNFHMQLRSPLPKVGTNIFTIMSSLANRPSACYSSGPLSHPSAITMPATAAAYNSDARP